MLIAKGGSTFKWPDCLSVSSKHNILLTIVVPIIPDVLYNIRNEDLSGKVQAARQNAENFTQQGNVHSEYFSMNSSSDDEFSIFVWPMDINNENEEVGILFASKAMIQLAINPIIGPLTNRMGCPTPMFLGTLTLVLSSFMFAYGETFSMLFAARSVHGVGSACICIAGYPFGSVMYDFVNKRVPLLIVACLFILDAALLLVFLKPRLEPERLLVGTSIVNLILDPYIILASGAICVSTLSIAVLEPCLPLWLMESLSPPKWQLGTVFIPDSLGYLVGTNLFGTIAFKIGRWLTAMIALILVGTCSIMIPLSSHVLELAIPHFGLGLGIGAVDASFMPLLAYLVDSRHVALYGTVYAIAQVAVCLAYSIGPLLGGYLVKKFGFHWVMSAIGLLNFLYCPFCCFLKDTPVIEENRAIDLEGTNYKATENSTNFEGRTGYVSFANEE